MLPEILYLLISTYIFTSVYNSSSETNTFLSELLQLISLSSSFYVIRYYVKCRYGTFIATQYVKLSLSYTLLVITVYYIIIGGEYNPTKLVVAAKPFLVSMAALD